MIKVAIIGVSGFGNTHYNDLIRYQARGELDIVGATIINQQEEAEKCAKLKSIGCEIFTDYRQMLEKFKGNLDICFIPTGISLHVPMSVAALEAGANVYVEKPVTATLSELKILKDAEKKSGKFVAVGYQTAYQPSIAEIKQAVLDGEIGQVHTIKFHGITIRDKAYYSRNNWAGRIKVGDSWILDSPFNNALAHQINLLCFFAGTSFREAAEIKTVQANLFKVNPDIENADNSAIEIITEDNKKLLYYVTHNAEKTEKTEMLIEGTKGFIRWDFDNTVYNVNGEESSFENYDSRDNVMNAIIARVNDENGFVCGLDIAGKQTLVVNAVHASSKIIEVPKEYVITLETKQSTSKCLKGISEVIHNAYKEERLYNSGDYPWMQTGAVIDVEKDDIEALLKRNTTI
jgi:predicted dehydrogenase